VAQKTNLFIRHPGFSYVIPAKVGINALVPTLCVGMLTDLTYETALEPKSEALPGST
jgi:hypothetical protein